MSLLLKEEIVSVALLNLWNALANGRPDTEMTARPCLDFNLCFCCSGAGEIALAVVESRRYKMCVCVCRGGVMGGGGGGQGK